MLDREPSLPFTPTTVARLAEESSARKNQPGSVDCS